MKIMACLMMTASWGVLLTCALAATVGITGPAVWPLLAVCTLVSAIAAPRVYPYLIDPSRR